MANKLARAFANFDEYLNLDPAERSSAQELHNSIRSALRESPLVEGSFLQGSFARKTMLSPLKDVDIVVLVNPEVDNRIAGPDGPLLAMEAFREVLEVRWPRAGFDEGDAPSAKALRVALPDIDFTIDLVPAIDESARYVSVGDRHERAWIKSNTRIQLDKVAARNVATGGSFVHQVRMVKQFVKNRPDLGFVKGIAVEALAYASIHEERDHAAAVARVLSAGAVMLGGSLLEPAGDDDITRKWTSGERRHVVEVFGDASSRAEEAIRLAEAGDERASIDVWSSVLGEGFPSVPAQSIVEALSTMASGSLTSTGRPSRTLAGATPSRPGRAWSTR